MASKMEVIKKALRQPDVLVRTTQPEEVRVGRGERYLRVESIFVDDEKMFESIAKAVAGLLAYETCLEQSVQSVDGKLKYRAVDRDAKAEDVVSATLVRHRVKGAGRGRELPDPYIQIVLSDGRYYRVDLAGRPLHTCKFCDRGSGPLLFAQHSRKHYHGSCLNIFLRDKERRKARAPELDALT